MRTIYQLHGVDAPAPPAPYGFEHLLEHRGFLDRGLAGEGDVDELLDPGTPDHVKAGEVATLAAPPPGVFVRSYQAHAGSLPQQTPA